MYFPGRSGSSSRRYFKIKIGANFGIGNVHIHDGVSEDEVVAMRTKCDATLAAPLLLLPSIQLNMRADKSPPARVNDVLLEGISELVA